MMNQRIQILFLVALGLFSLAALPANAKTLKDIVPAHYAGQGMPALSQMTLVSTDPAHDHKTDHLDILADHFAFSDARFYAAIRNRGGGFPTSARLGSVYYSYMVVIANLADDDVIWALTYIRVPLAGLKPGLYRIGGMDAKDLVRIGDIDYQIDPASNLLKMSCKISSLLSDPLFSAWYKPGNPSFGLGSTTNKTTVIPYKTSSPDTTYPGARIIPVISD